MNAEYVSRGDFSNLAAAYLFGILIAMYVGQLVWAFLQGWQKNRQNMPDSSDAGYNLFNCLPFHDDGLRNIWVFFILAIFLPVFLNSMSNLISLINHRGPIEQSQDLSGIQNALEAVSPLELEEVRQLMDLRDSPIVEDILQALELRESDLPRLREFMDLSDSPMAQRILTRLESWEAERQRMLEPIREVLASDPTQNPPGSDMPWPKWLYYICLTCIGVLITLEFSYLHTLRRSAPDWLPMLLSALVLDLIAMLVLIFVVGNPDDWKPNYPAATTLQAFLIATGIALLSSLLILVLARTAGALHDKQIEIEKVMDRIKKRHSTRRRWTLLRKKEASQDDDNL